MSLIKVAILYIVLKLLIAHQYGILCMYRFTSGPNSFYCICDKHKEKPVPVDTSPAEKTDESDKKNKSYSFACVIL